MVIHSILIFLTFTSEKKTYYLVKAKVENIRKATFLLTRICSLRRDLVCVDGLVIPARSHLKIKSVSKVQIELIVIGFVCFAHICNDLLLF